MAMLKARDFRGHDAARQVKRYGAPMVMAVLKMADAYQAAGRIKSSYCGYVVKMLKEGVDSEDLAMYLEPEKVEAGGDGGADGPMRRDEWLAAVREFYEQQVSQYGLGQARVMLQREMAGRWIGIGWRDGSTSGMTSG